VGDSEFSSILNTLAESAERVLHARTTPDAGPWVVIAVVPFSRSGPVATPMLAGQIRYSMRRFETAEEAIANSVAMPAAKMYGGLVLNIVTGETVRFQPFDKQAAV
jgi:hypothetical protein